MDATLIGCRTGTKTGTETNPVGHVPKESLRVRPRSGSCWIVTSPNQMTLLISANGNVKGH
jgi:hypothetical protein